MKIFRCVTIAACMLFLGGLSVAAWSAEAPLTRIARSVDEVPFISGGLIIPSAKGTNNRGTILEQTVPGITHIEAYIFWRYLEPQKDQWNLREFDEMLSLSRQHNLKMVVLPWIMNAPQWFKETPDYAPLVDMKTGKAIDHLSPWAPGTLAAYDHFYAELARRYRGQIDIIKLGYAGSDFGEVGLSISGAGYAPGEIAPSAANWKPDYCCGDPDARADFRAQMLERHGSLERLNADWGTRFATAGDIEFPDPERRAAQRRCWLDFIAWIEDSQVRNLVKILRVIRKHFPDTMLDLPLGFGEDRPRDGCDRTAICRAAADFQPITVRSTHASVNRDDMPRAYWFYKRMAPTCHRMGIGFGVEPPGGDLKYAELQREYFEDASAGANYIFQWFQNFHLGPDVVQRYKRVLRPQEQSLVDIAILYPTTQMVLDMSPFPGGRFEGQLQFCHLGREYFDYDLVDENMLGWGWLSDYKVLLHTSGSVFRESSLAAIGQWLKAGGVLITCGAPQWETESGRKEIAAAWLADEDRSAPSQGVRVYRVGQGRLYVAPAKTMPDYLTEAVAVLAATAKALPAGTPLEGFDGTDDGEYVTDFADGRLIFDTKTLATRFVGRAKGK